MQFLTDDYIIGYWFASNKNDDNVNFCLIKRGDEYIVENRFRYNKSSNNDNPFSNKDKKNFYVYRVLVNESSEDEMINHIDQLFKLSQSMGGFNVQSDHFRVDGDAMKFIEIAKTKEYFHIKEEKVH